MTEPSLFGQRLKALREVRGWTQAELGEKAKTPPAMISHFETGVRSSASADTLVKLANALRVSIDYLLGRTDDPTPIGGRVEALLRRLNTASGTTIQAVEDVADAFLRRDELERKKE